MPAVLSLAKAGLGFGMAVTGGNVDGEALPSYTTFGQNTFMTFASGVTEAGQDPLPAKGVVEGPLRPLTVGVDQQGVSQLAGATV